MAILLSVPVFAQLEVKKGSFKEVPGFVNINSDPNYQYDDNEKPFAVIKVRTENINDKQRHGLKFEGNGGTFVMLEYKTGEVWVYLTAKYASYLKISHPDFSSTEFYLPYDLKPKCGYEMTLVNNFVEPIKEVSKPKQKIENSINEKQVIQYTNGTYEGTILNGKRHGKGKYTWDVGDVYEGDWKDDKRIGKGKYTWPNGNVYNGYWKDGNRNGYGTMKYSDGVYEGQWKDDKKTGEGKFTWSNGDVYEGEWKNDERTGKGVFKWPSGDVYNGDFVDGVRTGEGIYTWPSGNVYEGDWSDNNMTGKGVFRWADGKVYEGDFLNDKKDGFGTMHYSDGVYEGEWKDDVRSGEGIFTNSNGKIYKGTWKDDRLVKNYTIWYILTIIIAAIAFVLLLRLKEQILQGITIGVAVLFLVFLIIYCYCLIVGLPNASTWGAITLAGMGGGVIVGVCYGIVGKCLSDTLMAIFAVMACLFIVGLIIILGGWISGSGHNSIWNILTLIGFCTGLVALILSMVFED